MKTVSSIGRRFDKRIVASWRRHEAAEPGISTERLMEMVRGDTGADVDRQIEALRRADVDGKAMTTLKQAMKIESTAPGYWMYETTGVLRPVIEAYLGGEPMTEAQIAAMRAYLRQWIGAPVWDTNPHAGPMEHAWLAGMRARIDDLTSRKAIANWLNDAVTGGIDPL
jgi:hypothetical protein